jgi:capsular polysaccharide biosynthesis protein
MADQKTRKRNLTRTTTYMNFIFSSPTLEDLVRLLRAWRFWVGGAILGALIGAALYFIAPPPYRARTTVNVDFNLEQAWPQDVDRQQFYYLEREVRKLQEIASSDDVLEPLSAQSGIPVQNLREHILQLSQPAEAGWHFYADDRDPKIAEDLASAWANAFVEKVQAEITAGNINEFVKLEVTQSENLFVRRSIPLGSYLLLSSLGFLTLAAFIVLFIKPKTT